MASTITAKSRKSNDALPPTTEGPVFEQTLLALETVCARILDTRFAAVDEYSDRLEIQQRFKNIVTPVSLALGECKGPRRFHYHYRHTNGNDEALEPAANPPPLDMLAQTCADALKQCQKKLLGLHEPDLCDNQQALEHALRAFLLRYRHFKIKEKEAESA